MLNRPHLRRRPHLPLLRWLLALLVAALLPLGLAPAATAAPEHHGRGSGSLVVIGGKLRENADILNTIIDLAGGPGRARIGIVTAASASAVNAAEANDPDQANASADGLYYSDLFARFGAVETYAVPIDTSAGAEFPGDAYWAGRADDPAVAQRLSRMTGFFFGGGDQFRYVTTMMHCDAGFTRCGDSRALAAVRRALAGGAVVSGVSAGDTILQGRAMVTGGESYQGWRDGSAPGYFADATKLGYLRSGGFGFFRFGTLDSHVGQYGREGRMIRLALDTNERFAFGVDETTALVVENLDHRPTMRVIGVNGVHLFDLRWAVRGSENGYATVRGVRWSYLLAGDRLDPRSLRLTPRDGTNLLPRTRSRSSLSPVGDVWSSADNPDGSGLTMVRLAQSLLTSDARTAEATTYETAPQFRVTLIRDLFTRGWQDASGVSFQQLSLGVRLAD